MGLRGGALVIGSLFWDTRMGRPDWRRRRLNVIEKFQVYLPIRYGRLSERGEREGTYTMVFSNKVYASGYELGTGWVFPFRREVLSFRDLKKEAREMGKAEGFRGDVSRDWGTVALLPNPSKEIDYGLGDDWTELMSTRLWDRDLLAEKLKSERPPIDARGFLTIRWPQEVSAGPNMKDLDFLIATATTPILVRRGKRPKKYKFPKYPTVHQIADAMILMDYDEYFKKNFKHGIVTFQDERIMRALRKRRS